jgi:hypothetical protein
MRMDFLLEILILLRHDLNSKDMHGDHPALNPMYIYIRT